MTQQTKKDWYKNWWGVLIAILFLPLFIVWYVWAKSKLSKVWKIIITVIVGIMFISALVNEPKSTTTTPKPKASTTTKTLSPEEQAKKTEAEDTARKKVEEEKTQKEAEKKAKAEQTAQEVKTPKYQILYELSNKRYDGGKNYYVLIDPVDLSSDSFKNDIKTIAKKIVAKKDNKISIEIHDKKATLDLSYKQYGDMSLGRVLNQSELDERAIHLIADYSGDLETNIYLNSLSFFPGAFEDNAKVGKYLETIEFDAFK